MSLYSQWTDMAQMVSNDQQQMQAFWDEYFVMEAEVYKKILQDKKFVLSGSVKELADFAEMEPVVFSGFVDGINTSLKKEIDLESLAEDTQIELDIDAEKLFYNMLDAKAKWLYTLPQWEEVLPAEKRDDITREWRKAGQAISEKTVGRNDPCPCGSGKKYKKCCGQ